MLITILIPYRRFGLLFQEHRDHFGARVARQSIESTGVAHASLAVSSTVGLDCSSLKRPTTDG